jgi:DNA-binding response OmpR family regulator
MSIEPSLAPARVLVVDDNEIKRYTTCRTLERAGIAVVEATTGEEALRALRVCAERPSVVVLDVKLPDIDGFEVCRRIKADPETASTLVLHLSAHLTTSHDQAMGLEGGADGYLAVPIAAEVLVATVRSLMRLARAEKVARTAERHWTSTFDAIGDAVFLVGADGRVARCNLAAATLLQRSADAILGADLAALLRKSLDIDVGDVFQPSFAGPGPMVMSADVETSAGAWLRVTVDPVDLDQRGGLVCCLSDITARKLLEGRLTAAYEHERRIAESFQRSLVRPRPVEHSHLLIEPLYLPAWDEANVGGDFYDVFPLGPETVALVIADASGKGLAAATRTAEVKYSLRAFLWKGMSPAEALAEMNRLMCHASADADLGSFVTAVLAVIDAAAGDISVCTAGMEPPLLLRNTGEQVTLMQSSTLPLGIDPSVVYTCGHWQMELDDTVLMATDGITEARRGTELFGYARMAEAAGTALGASTLSRMGERIVEQARAFAGGTFHDDVCLLLARRRRNPAGDGGSGCNNKILHSPPPPRQDA